jgi:hypothetical protein
MDNMIREIDAALKRFADEIREAATASGDGEVVALASNLNGLWEMIGDGYLAFDGDGGLGFRPAENRAERRRLRRKFKPLAARYFEMMERGMLGPRRK